MAPKNRIVLARHGETEWSRDRKHTSVSDVPLTGAGREEAEGLGAALAGHRFDRVLSSPMQRATETCRLAGFGEPEVIDDLREWAYGEYEGRTTAEIREEMPGWTVWTHPSPGGETAEEVGTRVDRVVKLLRSMDGDAIVFSHGHLLRVLGARWIDLEVADGGRLGLSTGAICELGYERETPVLWLWNETRHIKR